MKERYLGPSPLNFFASIKLPYLFFLLFNPKLPLLEEILLKIVTWIFKMHYLFATKKNSLDIERTFQSSLGQFEGGGGGNGMKEFAN